MAYNPAWTNSASGGRVAAGVSNIKLCDAQELAGAINRRRRATFQSDQSFSSHIYSGAAVRRSLLSTAVSPPFDNFRLALSEKILNPPTGVISGSPPSPMSFGWRWPVADGDQGKPLVSGLSGVPSGCVGLVQKINGTNNWTDGTLSPGGTFIRASHANELRMATEYVRRGFMTFPIYWCSGLFSILPDSSWLAEFIANNGDDELRNVGYGFLTIPGSSPTVGISNATVLSGYIEVTADGDCTAEVYHCLRPIDRVNLLSSWNEYDQTLGGSWGTPGGIGSGDSTSIGSVALAAGVPGRITGGGVTSALQAMVNGAEQNFLIRRGDTGWETIHVSATAGIEFELNGPPN